MQHDGQSIARRLVRIGAIALVFLGVFALWQDRARAQFGVELLRKVVDKAKSKQPAKAPPLKAKPNLKGPITKAPIVKDAIGKTARPGGVDKIAKDRLPKDKLDRDKLLKDRLAKDRAAKDRLAKDKLGKDKSIAKDQPGKDKLAKDKLSKDKLAKDKLAKDKLGKDKLGKDKLAQDKLGKDKLGKDKLGKDKLGKDKLGKDKLGKDKLGDPKSAKAPPIPDKRAATRIVQAKSPVERGRIRSDHRRELLSTRLRLPPRPFPGTPGFSGVPPAGETRFVSTETVFHVSPNVPRATVEASAKRLGLTIVGVQTSGITGGTLYHFGLPPGRRVADVVRSLEAERVGIASPNYVYRIAQDTASDTASAAGTPEQYTVEKLRLTEVHKVSTGREVLVAVIDSKVDIGHPDLAGAVVDEYDAVRRAEQAHSHGTGMAGAIASHRKLLGIAPGARILAVHAFSTSSRQSAEATTRQIIEGIEWAINRGARIINMSFAGPYDPMIQLAMRNAAAKGIVLIAASGNMGAKSPPLYPAADPNVIAVTATDESDMLFPQAVRGPHLAVAAPGVDIVVPAPNDTYQLTTGTSVAAAHVSGVAALLLERHPTVNARTVIEVLTATARNLNPKGRDDQYGWGLIDPTAALQELDSRIVDGKLLATAKPAPPTTAAKSTLPTTAAPKIAPKTAAPKIVPPSPAAATLPPSARPVPAAR
ncbi:MAG: S8 family serine peptidase [Hyphomicrobiales bacterium]|nr:S8 family serine peptidase [Hyphomicrobiales bacterium]